jgi:ubiquinone/menaquinone biosynthesis C-methylase UbiE
LVKGGQTVVDVGCGAGYFSFALAELVGPEGTVLALDIQDRMLAIARRRAERRGLGGRIEFRLCEEDGLGIPEPVDFVLAFWMAHEVSDQDAFFAGIKASLRPEGMLLLVEPKVHVPRGRFEDIIGSARASGFSVAPGPKVFFSRSVVCSALPLRFNTL